MFPCVCLVIDHKRRQNVVRTSVTHSAIASCATFLFFPHFDVICDLLLNRRTATWNLFVNRWIILVLHASRRTFRSRVTKNNFLNLCFTEKSANHASREYPCTTLSEGYTKTIIIIHFRLSENWWIPGVTKVLSDSTGLVEWLVGLAVSYHSCK